MAQLTGVGTVQRLWISEKEDLQTFEIAEITGSKIRLRSRSVDFREYNNKLVQFKFEVSGDVMGNRNADGTSAGRVQSLEVMGAQMAEVTFEIKPVNGKAAPAKEAAG